VDDGGVGTKVSPALVDTSRETEATPPDTAIQAGGFEKEGNLKGEKGAEASKVSAMPGAMVVQPLPKLTKGGKLPIKRATL